ncbi:unnamed protein product [Dovyalis caffra]|uniref:RRM domain-containing protein n=1 Tax=Dovyalis caffra TaxID=77055 RepID=A0AAV1R5M8_9ROSI|nr:unnamed protein product [Dovyalis caffra]
MRNSGTISTSLEVQNDEVAEAGPFDALQPLFGKLMSEWESRLSLIDDVLDEADQKPDTNQAMKNWLSKLRDLAYDVEDILDECQTEALKRKLKGAESQASTSTVQPSASLPSGPKLQGIAARWEDIMKERSDLGLDINVIRRSNKANPRVQTTSPVKEPKQWYGSNGLNEEPGGKFPNLVKLKLENCEDCFPDDDGLLLPTSLTLLHIYNQKKLKSISSGIQHLTSLEQLWFDNCPELHVLPKEGFPAALGLLKIVNCPLWEKEQMHHLRTLGRSVASNQIMKVRRRGVKDVKVLRTSWRLSFSSTEKTIVAAFSEFGEVIEAKIVMDKARNRPKGYGYVTFSKKDDVVKACEGMNGKGFEFTSVPVARPPWSLISKRIPGRPEPDPVLINVANTTISTSLQIQKEKEAEADLQLLFGKLMSEWESRLLQIRSMLDDEEQKQLTNRAMEIWLDKLRDLACDVEDIVDEFETEVLTSKLKSAESQASTSTVQPSAAMPNGPKLQGIAARWEDIVKERSDLDINVIRRSNKANPRVQTTSLVKEPKVYGREKAKEDLVQLLMKAEPINSRSCRGESKDILQNDEVAEADPVDALQPLFAKLMSEWESRLLLINDVLDDAEQKPDTNQSMKNWLSKLRGLAYDVEDILDELQTEASQASTSTVQPSAAILNSLTLQKLAARWEDILKEKNDLGVLLEWEHWDLSDGLNEEPAGGKFPKLVELTLQNCPKLIGKFPGCLPSLKKLHISGCPQLTNLPEMVPSLRELKVECCDEVIFRMAPNFTSLTTLEIREISGLVGLHEAFVEALVALEDLKIKHCRELKYLWQDGVDVDKLANLQSLCILWCKQLVSLVEGAEGILPYSLKRLEMRWCDSMESLPDGMMTVMSSNNSNQCLLEELVIQDCPSLKSLPRGKLPATIKKLDVEGCKELESEYRFLEGIMRCDAHLEYLRVSKFSITSFPTGKFPTSLKALVIDRCKRIQSLPSLLNLSNLTKLIIQGCHELESFSDQELPSLTSLFIWYCKKLRSFPEAGLPSKLTSLTVMGCENLRQPISEWRLHTLTYLKRLTISNTTDEDCFPDDDGLLLPTSLTSLQISDQKKLKSISSGIQHLTSLEELQFVAPLDIFFKKYENISGMLAVVHLIKSVASYEQVDLGESLGAAYLVPNYWPVVLFRQWAMQHVFSLRGREFWITKPKMKKCESGGFPATLGYLLINSSPLLKERCLKEEGDYWPLVAHIPCVDIDDEEISEEETSNAEISDDDTSNEEATNGRFTDEAFFLKLCSSPLFPCAIMDPLSY